MAAAAMNHTTNGPSIPMYQQRPYQTVDNVVIPDIMYKLNPYYEVTPVDQRSSSQPKTSCAAAGSLEERQENVLKRLEEMQASVAQLALRYKVKDPAPSSSGSPASTSSATNAASLPKFVAEAGRTLDLVISADPSSAPLSLVVMCERLAQQFPTMLSTFVHSSVEAKSISPRLQKLLVSNGSCSRADCQVAVTLIWKKVSPSPQLVVDPVHQTTIQGEANMARYLWALVSSSDLDPVSATQQDELLDLAQLQVFQGNNKERAAAIRQLNSLLGKQRAWLMGGAAPTLVDIVCWSAVQQAGLAQGAPANVQRWLAASAKHGEFSTALALVQALES